jgi:site-specific recombinase XerD
MTNRRNVKSDKSAVADGHERSKNFLSEKEIDRLLDAARKNRHGIRDHLILLMMYRHGLRVSELISIKLADLNLQQGRLWIRRLKNGLSVEQPLAGDELRAIKRYLKTRDSALPWLFLSERGQPMTRQSINYITATAGHKAKLGDIHPHMLRHSCGFYLANKGYDLRLIQDYLGHRDPKHTAHYTRVASYRFENLWKD